MTATLLLTPTSRIVPSVFRIAALILFAAPLAAQSAKRPLRAADLYSLKDVRDPHRSPDGKWVAYTVSSADSAKDKNDSDIWMTSWDGAQSIRLTSTPESESSPRWSPDGKWLAFLSSRQGSDDAQLWMLNRIGGEATKVSDVKGAIDSYEWSPDSKRIVMVVQDPDPEEAKASKDTTKSKTKKPIVIDRYHFKEDIEGYLGPRRSHLYLFDVESHKAELLTPGEHEESNPAWSPDGSRIAFVSKRFAGDLDRSDNSDVFVMDAKPGADAKQLTTWPGPDNSRGSSHLAWSPDGQSIAYLQGSELKLYAYNLYKLAVVPAAGGQPRVLTAPLDRGVSDPYWSADGKTLYMLVEDDRSQYLAKVPVAGGAVERVTGDKRVLASLSLGGDGSGALLAASDSEPPEVWALDGAHLRKLSHQNDSWLSQIQLGVTEEFTSRSKDGTEVHGLLVKPAGYTAGQKYPTLLRIHGGPNGQDAHAFNFERELFAANGYVVVAANYRGSAGRGAAYQSAIFADWGNKEVVDLLGAVDHVVKIGLADPSRLGIGGWSYGGILTNYTIATDHRFKAATSGAGSSNQISMYGTDEYITQYEAELGAPWKNQEAWIKVSYPFFHADRINTPTLFLGGEKDFNVPLLGSEQMYQALKSLNVDARLIVYPGQYHGITTPSYKRDRLERYLEWYGRYLGAPRT
ncbi:MAG: S9 family peptidase [Gemmatimonadota bacterium]|nr:S9 family peptidase [Gemmatimonadota bacterium]